MNCRNAAQLFSDRIEGRLDQRQAERLQAHLDHCPDCDELLKIMELNIIQLEGVPEPPLPEGLEQRLFAIPQFELAETRSQRPADTAGAGSHWLFSNAAAAVILAMFITANLTWFNPDFQDSIRGCRRLIDDKSAMALELASDWSTGLNDLKQRVEYKLDRVRNAGEAAAKDSGESEEQQTGLLVTEIIRALGLIGA